MRRPKSAHGGKEAVPLLFRWCGLGSLGSREYGVIGTGAGEHDGQSDRGEHEDYGRVGGELGEDVGGTTGTEGGLRALTAEGTGEVSGLALLEEDYSDEEEGDNDVKDNDEIDHPVAV